MNQNEVIGAIEDLYTAREELARVRKHALAHEECIGACEACSRLIFEYEGYGTDNEGYTFCPSCYRAMRDEPNTERAQAHLSN